MSSLKNKKLKTDKLVQLIKKIYGRKKKEIIQLHEPYIKKIDSKNVLKTIKKNKISNHGGEYIYKFENQIKKITKSKYCLALNSGTSALHILMKSIGCNNKHEVITQSITFVATCNAIKYCDSDIVFVDISKKTLGMCPESLENFIKKCTIIRNKKCINKISKKQIIACLPVHTFGSACEIDKIKKICKKNYIKLIEDSSESLGTYYKQKHTGTFGVGGVFSFNYNKIITTGSGGALITNSGKIYNLAKHLSATAKLKHRWDFIHNKVGYNYRMPNMNAALGYNQLKSINYILKKKKILVKKYKLWSLKNDIKLFNGNLNKTSNSWLLAIILPSLKDRNYFLNKLNNNKINARPIWRPMHKLPPFTNCLSFKLTNTLWAEKRIINLPSFNWN